MMRAIVRRLRRRLASDDGSQVRGALDGIDARGLQGWAVGPGGPAKVDIRIGERVVVAVDAVRPRPDVAAAGAGPLNCGFSLDMEQLSSAALRAGASPPNAPLRLTADGVELPSPLPSLHAEALVEADALAWFVRAASV